MADHDALAPTGQQDRQHAQQRRPVDVEAGGGVLLQQPGELGVGVRSGVGGQVDVPERDGRLLDEEGDRPVEHVVREAGAQVVVPVEHAGDRCGESLLGDGRLQVDDVAHGVDVTRRLVVQGLEEQALLQRRQRQHLGEVGVPPAQPLGLVGGQLQQRRSRTGVGDRLLLRGRDSSEPGDRALLEDVRGATAAVPPGGRG